MTTFSSDVTGAEVPSRGPQSIYEPGEVKRCETLSTYIPTYIAAVKSNSTVTLDDVVRDGVATAAASGGKQLVEEHRIVGEEDVSIITTGSTGLLTETTEPLSTWDEDDEAFMRYVAKQQEEKSRGKDEKVGDSPAHPPLTLAPHSRRARGGPPAAKYGDESSQQRQKPQSSHSPHYRHGGKRRQGGKQRNSSSFFASKGSANTGGFFDRVNQP